MAKIQVLLKKNMRDDSCLHFILGVSDPDQGKCITLELYFTFELFELTKVCFKSFVT